MSLEVLGFRHKGFLRNIKHMIVRCFYSWFYDPEAIADEVSFLSHQDLSIWSFLQGKN